MKNFGVNATVQFCEQFISSRTKSVNVDSQQVKFLVCKINKVVIVDIC